MTGPSHSLHDIPAKEVVLSAWTSVELYLPVKRYDKLCHELAK